MSISLTTPPPAFAFSGDFVTARFTSLGYLATAGVNAENYIIITARPVNGNTFVFKYGAKNFTITVRATPNDSGLEVPEVAPEFDADLDTCATILANSFKENADLNEDFTISASLGTIYFVAKKKGKGFDFLSGSTGAVATAGVEEVLKPNYSITFKLYIENADNTAFQNIYTSQLQLINGTAGQSEARLNDKLHSAIEADLRKLQIEYPETTAIACKKSCRKYYFEFAESYGETIAVKKLHRSENYTILHGGLSARAQFNTTLNSLLAPNTANNDRFLKQGATAVYTRTNQPQYLYFFNTRTTKTAAQLVANVAYADGTNATEILLDTVNLEAHRKYAFNVTFDYLKPLFAAKTVNSYTVYLKHGGSQISEQRSYTLDYSYRQFVRYFLSWSSFGSFDTRLFYGKGESEFELFNKTAERVKQAGDDIKLGHRISFGSKLTRQFNVATGFMSRRELQLNADFYLSDFKYRYTGGLLLPIEISAGKIPELQDGNNLCAQKIEYKYLYDDHAYTEGDAEDNGDTISDFFFSSPHIAFTPGSFTETDPTVPAWVKTITIADINRWNSAANPSDLSNFYNRSEIAAILNGSTSLPGYNKNYWDTAYTNSHTHSNKAFLDAIVNGATVGINISGSAAKWAGNEFSLGELITPTYFITGLGSSNWGYSTLSNLKNTLAISLQDVTNVNPTTTTGATFGGNVNAPSVKTTNWFVSNGATGWVNETYGGGIYMDDATWLRTYNGKGLYVAGATGILAAGAITSASKVAAPTIQATAKMLIPTVEPTVEEGEVALYAAELSGTYPTVNVIANLGDLLNVDDSGDIGWILYKKANGSFGFKAENSGGVSNWNDLAGKPTTIAGFGITDAFTKSEIDGFFSGAFAKTGYNKSYWDTAYTWGNHATAGYLTAVSWTMVSDKPTALSHFTNDLGNYGNWTTKAQNDGYYPSLTGYNKSYWDTAYTNTHTHSNKAFLDTIVNDATVGINISGSAAKWSGIPYAGVGSVGGYLYTYDEVLGVARLTTLLNVKTSLATSLQDVTNVGNTAYTDIYISKSVPALRLYGTQVGGKNYALTSGIIGVSNAGFAVRNETDARNEFYIDYLGNAGFGGNVNAPTVKTTNWFVSNGATGWLNETYGGGIYMDDATWLRTYGGKGLYVAGATGILAAGEITSATKVAAPTIQATAKMLIPTVEPTVEEGEVALYAAELSGTYPTVNVIANLGDLLNVDDNGDIGWILYKKANGSFGFKAENSGGVSNWNDLAGKPTTIAGFGITDAFTKGEIDGFFSGAFAKTGYNKSYWDTAYTNTHTHSNKAFLDTIVNGATLGINISGSAAKWAGNEFSLGELITPTYFITGLGSSNWGYSTLSNLKSTLAISLQDVTSVGNTAYTDIYISKTVPALRLYGTQSGGKNYALTSGIVGVSNTGFAIRNETDSRNEFYIDYLGNAGFGQDVAAKNFNSTGTKIGFNITDTFSFDGVARPHYGLGYGLGTSEVAYTTLSGYYGLNFFTNGVERFKINTAGDATFGGNVNAPSVKTTNWFVSNGVTGWFNETYGGGIYMEDATWLRIYNGKGLYVAGTTGISAAGLITSASKVAAPTIQATAKMLIPTVEPTVEEGEVAIYWGGL